MGISLRDYIDDLEQNLKDVTRPILKLTIRDVANDTMLFHIHACRDIRSIEHLSSFINAAVDVNNYWVPDVFASDLHPDPDGFAIIVRPVERTITVGDLSTDVLRTVNFQNPNVPVIVKVNGVEYRPSDIQVGVQNHDGTSSFAIICNGDPVEQKETSNGR